MTRPDPDHDPRGQPGGVEPQQRDLEAPAADAVEQSTPVDPDEATDSPLEVSPGAEAAEWDMVEQSIVIDLDDEYDR